METICSNPDFHYLDMNLAIRNSCFPLLYLIALWSLENRPFHVSGSRCWTWLGMAWVPVKRQWTNREHDSTDLFNDWIWGQPWVTYSETKPYGSHIFQPWSHSHQPSAMRPPGLLHWDTAPMAKDRWNVWSTWNLVKIQGYSWVVFQSSSPFPYIFPYFEAVLIIPVKTLHLEWIFQLEISIRWRLSHFFILFSQAFSSIHGLTPWPKTNRACGGKTS